MQHFDVRNKVIFDITSDKTSKFLNVLKKIVGKHVFVSAIYMEKK